jgi:hypothetical protein
MTADSAKRPSASDALMHEWLKRADEEEEDDDEVSMSLPRCDG